MISASKMPVVKKTGRRDPLKTVNNLFKSAVANPTECVLYARDEDDAYTWWILVRGATKFPPGSPGTFKITGPDDEFYEAEFLFKMELHKVEPHAQPPKFYPMTPNCVYKVGTRPCIGIGEYHSDAFLATLGPDGFAREIANGINVYDHLGGGMHLIYGSTNAEQKKEVSQKSREFNWNPAGERTVKISELYGDERLIVNGNREIMKMMEIQHAKNVKSWLKSYARKSEKNPEMAGRIMNSIVRANFEKDPRYLNDLRWCPDPSYDYKEWTSLVDVVIMKFLLKQTHQVMDIVAGADYWVTHERTAEEE